MRSIRLLRRVERTARLLRCMLTAAAALRIAGDLTKSLFFYRIGKERKH